MGKQLGVFGHGAASIYLCALEQLSGSKAARNTTSAAFYSPPIHTPSLALSFYFLPCTPHSLRWSLIKCVCATSSAVGVSGPGWARHISQGKELERAKGALCLPPKKAKQSFTVCLKSPQPSILFTLSLSTELRLKPVCSFVCKWGMKGYGQLTKASQVGQKNHSSSKIICTQ